jgi:hypothetical protein
MGDRDEFRKTALTVSDARPHFSSCGIDRTAGKNKAGDCQKTEN